MLLLTGTYLERLIPCMSLRTLSFPVTERLGLASNNGIENDAEKTLSAWLYNCINNYNIPYKQQKPDTQTGCMKHVLHTNCHSTKLVKTTTRQLQFSTVGCNPSVYAQMINSHLCIHAAAHFPIYMLFIWYVVIVNTVIV